MSARCCTRVPCAGRAVAAAGAGHCGQQVSRRPAVRGHSPRVLLSASAAVERNHFVARDGRFAHGTRLARGFGLEPRVQTRPAAVRGQEVRVGRSEVRLPTRRDGRRARRPRLWPCPGRCCTRSWRLGFGRRCWPPSRPKSPNRPKWTDWARETRCRTCGGRRRSGAVRSGQKSRKKSFWRKMSEKLFSKL